MAVTGTYPICWHVAQPNPWRFYTSVLHHVWVASYDPNVKEGFVLGDPFRSAADSLLVDPGDWRSIVI